MSLKAIKSNVIVKPSEKVKETESGIYTGERYNPELGMRRGIVIAIGDSVREVKIGDEVCFLAHNGLPLHYNNERHLVMPEIEIFGIVQPTGAQG